ncbi:MAG: beta-carotene 15,15'-monooxygenase [Actinomycetaceae bacterium]|nr:beta-carotene 15,15'-monooxygenase [Actinomycetaceae bacterium]
MILPLILLACGLPLTVALALRIYRPTLSPIIQITAIIISAVLLVGLGFGPLVTPGPWVLPIVTIGALWAILVRDLRGLALIWSWALVPIAVVIPYLVGSPSESIRGSTLMTIIGAILLLALPANEFVSAVLDTATRKVDTPPPLPSFRGGRWIGALERILILLLAFTGNGIGVAVVVAAKGVIRFPEISKDEGGAKAEEFLVGSLTSWTLATLGTLIVMTPTV